MESKSRAASLTQVLSLTQPLLQAPSTFGCVLVTQLSLSMSWLHSFHSQTPGQAVVSLWAPWSRCAVASIPPDVLEESSPPPLPVPLQ